MLVIMKEGSDAAQTREVLVYLEDRGVVPHVVPNLRGQIVYAPSPPNAPVDPSEFGELAEMEGVDRLQALDAPPFLCSRGFRKEDTAVRAGDTPIGGGAFTFMAGPCAVETREKFLDLAVELKELGAGVLRGGVYKARSSPFTFRGLGEHGLEILAEASALTGLPIVTEVLHPREVRSVSRYAGILQIGARNMQDWPLLEAAAETGRPILLKRGMMATVDEWLTAAEYIMIRGNPHVILCERGIRTFEPGTRNTLDLAAAARIKDFSHLPIVVDPSHAAGQRELVPALASAGAAAGADGLMIEVHAHPHRAWSDGRQSITPETFGQIVRQVRALLRALGRAPKENTLES